MTTPDSPLFNLCFGDVDEVSVCNIGLNHAYTSSGAGHSSAQFPDPGFVCKQCEPGKLKLPNNQIFPF